jgi:serine/threonine-protein kinase
VAEKYRVERELASGGVGIVVLATHVELGHRVAIKFLRAQYLTDLTVTERFKREARLAAALRSEHVVRIHDVGTADDGLPFMVLEYLEGEDLGAIVDRGPVSIPQAIEWMLDVCRGLSEAHAMGVDHRDNKPENLFFTRHEGRPIIKVLDFGISKVVARGDAPRLSRLTQDYERFGTPAYMSPEQLLSSASVDARSDVWALGVVLYELLTAELPFPGEELPVLVSNILTSEPRPLRRSRPDAPPALEALVQKCLSRDPARRPSSVDVLARCLRRISSQLGAASAGTPVSSSREATTASASELALSELLTPAVAWVPAGAHSPTAPVAPQTLHVDHQTFRRAMLAAGLVLSLGGALALAGKIGAALQASTRDRDSITEPPGGYGIVPATQPPLAAVDLGAGTVPPSTGAPSSSPSASIPPSTPTVHRPSGPRLRAPAPSRSAPPSRPPGDYDQFGGRD